MADSYSKWAVPSLRDMRWSKRWTQTELAQRSGVSRHTIVRLERGESAQIGTIRRLAKALGASVDRLLQETEEDE